MKFNQAAFDMIKPMPPFKADLRQANRENKKTQTRRMMKPQPNGCYASFDAYHQDVDMIGDFIYWDMCIADGNGFVDEHGNDYKCPYGYPTDLRYMREPLFKGPFDFAHYVDDKTVAFNLLTGEPIKWNWKIDVLSQLYMPKVAARTFKRYDFIRAERLKSITEADAMAEGVTPSIVGDDIDRVFKVSGIVSMIRVVSDGMSTHMCG
jgi:hypothetical protein